MPGLFREKIDSLIRGLPKKFRKKLVPVARTVDIVANEMAREKGSLATALSRFLHCRLDVDIPADTWPVETLPEHLKTRLNITDPTGKSIETSRDPAILKQQKANSQPTAQLAKLRAKWEKTGITAQTFPDLPDTVRVPVPGADPWVVFPALTLEEELVAIRLFSDSKKALASHRRAVRKLYTDYFTKDLKFLKRKLLLPEYLTLSARHFGGKHNIEKQIEDILLDILFAQNIRNRNNFLNHAAEISPGIMNGVDNLVSGAKSVIEAYSESYAAIESLWTRTRLKGSAGELLETLTDELRKLIPENFITLYSAQRLPHLVRYIKAIAVRSRRAMDAPEKDRLKAAQINVHVDRLKELLGTFTPTTTAEKRTAVEKYFWMIEEYKVSQFAQELKTVEKVSAKRLDRLYADILRIA